MYLKLLHFEIISGLLSRSTFSAKCQSKPWPLVLGALDGDFVLNCLAVDASMSSGFAVGHSNSASIVGSSISNRGSIIELNSEPEVINSWY